MEKIIFLSPVIIGIILIAIGMLIYLNRTRAGIHTTGVVTGTKKSIKTVAGVKTIVTAPVVKYTLNGREYTAASYKFFPEDTFLFKKGEAIKIRISRKNPNHFVPEKDSTAEKILICCGAFMIIAAIVMYFRYY